MNQENKKFNKQEELEKVVSKEFYIELTPRKKKGFRSKPGFTGSFLEITKRKRGSLETYFWANIQDISLKTRKYDPKKEETTKHYLFKPSSARIMSNKNEKHVVLKGSLGDYNIPKNKVFSLKKGVKVILDRVPAYKSRVIIKSSL